MAAPMSDAVSSSVPSRSNSTARISLIASMAANPILIERPILLANGKAALGRPPEKVLDILKKQ